MYAIIVLNYYVTVTFLIRHALLARPWFLEIILSAFMSVSTLEATTMKYLILRTQSMYISCLRSLIRIV